jgi:hypothetical protein
VGGKGVVCLSRPLCCKHTYICVCVAGGGLLVTAIGLLAHVVLASMGCVAYNTWVQECTTGLIYKHLVLLAGIPLK